MIRFVPFLGGLAVAGATVLAVVAILRSEYLWAHGMQDAVLTRFERYQNETIDLSMNVSDGRGTYSSFTKAFRLFFAIRYAGVGRVACFAERTDAWCDVKSSRRKCPKGTCRPNCRFLKTISSSLAGRLRSINATNRSCTRFHSTWPQEKPWVSSITVRPGRAQFRAF